MSEKNKIADKIPFLQKLKNVKHIEIYFAVIVILIVGATYFGGISTTTKVEKVETSSTFEYANYMENKLSKILSQIDGAGNVSVMLSLEGTSEIVYATSTEEKTNSSSITNGSTSNTIITTEPIFASGEPIIVKEYLPKITGVIVVSQGASDIKVKLELLKAVQTLLDVPMSKIEILNGSK